MAKCTSFHEEVASSRGICEVFWTCYKASASGALYAVSISHNFLVSKSRLISKLHNIADHCKILCHLSLANSYYSLVGIVYKTWVTPVKDSATLHNTRTGLGGFADRVGALAYALTPLTVALGSRESILSLATGIPYQSFNFLHRWSGRIIFFQGVLHTFGWCLIEARLYVPQPTVWKKFIKQLYMIWGVIALVFITFLYVFSLRRVIRLTGYEFFKKTHYIVAMLYIGACWGHWSQLACWMIASIALWGIDRGVRYLRTILIHYGYANGSTGELFTLLILSCSMTNYIFQVEDFILRNLPCIISMMKMEVLCVSNLIINMTHGP